MNRAHSDRFAPLGAARHATIGKALLASATLVAAVGASAANLGEIYAEALKQDPVLAGTRANTAASMESVVQARASLMPQMSASVSRSAGTVASNRLQADGLPTPDTTTSRNSWNAQLSQPVVNVPSWFGYRSAQAGAKQAEWQLREAEQALITRVAEAYLSVLRGEAALESAVAAEEAVQRQLEQVQQRFDVGLVAITDVLESKAEYDNAVVQRIQAEGNHDIFFEGLRTLTGTPILEVDRIDASLPIIDPSPAEEDEWVDTAMANNYRIRSAQEGLVAAERQLKSALARHLPTLNASVGYGASDGSQSFGGLVFQDPGTSSLNYSLSLSMPIFQGLRNYSGVRQARHGLERARQQLIAQELTVGRDTRSLYRIVVTEVVRVGARNEAIKSSQSALEATQTGYEVGTRNIVDVLVAQRRLFASQFDYANSRYDYVLNLLRLRESAGVLDERDIAELNAFMDSANPVRPFSAR